MPNNFNTSIQATIGRAIEPSIGFTKNTKPSINIAKFGDGYSQRAVSGINNMPGTWRLTFKDQPLDVVSAIEAFLIARGGTEAFYWTPTGDTQVTVICPEGWDIEYTSPISKTLTTTFNQVYDPL